MQVLAVKKPVQTDNLESPEQGSWRELETRPTENCFLAGKYTRALLACGRKTELHTSAMLALENWLFMSFLLLFEWLSTFD